MFHIIHNFCISNHLFPLLTQTLSNLWSLYFLFLFFAGAWGRCFAFKLFGLGFREPSVQQRDCAGLQQKKRSRSHTQTPFDFSSALLIPSLLSLLRKKKKNSFLRQTSVCVSYMIILSISTLFHTLIPLLGKKGEVRRTSPIFNNMTVDDKQKLCRHSVFFLCVVKSKQAQVKLKFKCVLCSLGDYLKYWLNNNTLKYRNKEK